MSSFLQNLSPDEIEILKKFRKSVADILEPKHDDYYLLRWLRARNFKLREAEDMLRKVISKYWPVGIICYDKIGCPVTLMRYGEADLKGLVYSTRRSESMAEFIHYMELTEKLMRERNSEQSSPVFGVLIIADMTNFSLHSSTCAPVFIRIKDVFYCLDANYPESLRAIYVINAPAIFQFLLALIKPFMNEKTFKKFHVYGKGGWKEKLLEEIDEEVLPVKFGGKRIGPNNDVNAIDLVPEGGTVPKSYYIQKKLCNEEEAKIVEVQPRTSYTVEVLVEKPESVLNWEFMTKDHNIGFGLFYICNGNLEEIVGVEKQSCHIVPENGSWLCAKAGKYVLKFDNSFSWIRPKMLSYWTQVVPPPCNE